MSSTAFSAELHPDPRLRQLVLGSGLLLAGAGIPIIATLGIVVSARALLAAAWVVVSAWRWLSFRRAYARNGIFRVDPGGEILCECVDGGWKALELLPGSIVTAGWAWLRLGQANGHDYAELLRRETCRSQDWRRFQVIWRHVGAVP